MIIKKGELRKYVDYGDGAYFESIGIVIEKVDGNYTEYLFCKVREETIVNGSAVNGEYNDNFKVYYGKTLSEVLTLNGFTGTTYTWTEPLTQIS